MMAANIGQKIIISMKSTNMPVSIHMYCLKQKFLKFYVYL